MTSLITDYLANINAEESEATQLKRQLEKYCSRPLAVGFAEVEGKEFYFISIQQCERAVCAERIFQKVRSMSDSYKIFAVAFKGDFFIFKDNLVVERTKIVRG